MDEALLVRPVAGDSAGNRRNGVIRDLEILPLVFLLEMSVLDAGVSKLP